MPYLATSTAAMPLNLDPMDTDSRRFSDKALLHVLPSTFARLLMVL
jgi:hypothetical protein